MNDIERRRDATLALYDEWSSPEMYKQRAIAGRAEMNALQAIGRRETPPRAQTPAPNQAETPDQSIALDAQNLAATKDEERQALIRVALFFERVSILYQNNRIERQLMRDLFWNSAPFWVERIAAKESCAHPTIEEMLARATPSAEAKVSASDPFDGFCALKQATDEAQDTTGLSAIRSRAILGAAIVVSDYGGGVPSPILQPVGFDRAFWRKVAVLDATGLPLESRKLDPGSFVATVPLPDDDRNKVH
ncbi:MAG: hypothetical protein SGJ23_13370 [Alphaproteobacteria bacterium]|nr:hypothetical protein [Alphaproteobacteria bacterium]